MMLRFLQNYLIILVMANMLKGLCMFPIQRYSIQIRFKKFMKERFLNRSWVAGVF